LVLQVVLNMLRALPLEHLGKTGIDGFCFRVFGEKWTLFIKIIIFYVCLLY
jgi:hypothetical protein